MGLLKAVGGAIGGVLADQWKEYFYCDSLPTDILVSKGAKRVSRRSSNTKGEDNIISNGSVIAVNEGQFMIIVDQGKVIEFSGEPGEFMYDTSTEPSLFYGKFGENLKKTFATVGKRIGFGGDTAKDQRVYFFNTKEIIGNKYGTPNAVPFRVTDANIGLDMDISIRCHGEYSYKIVDPLLFYTNVCGNISGDYSRESIDGQLKSELMTALQPAFAKISEMGIRYSALPGHTMELADALNEILSQKWSEMRGIRIASFGVSSVKASDEDEAMLKELQRNATFRDPNMAAAEIVGAQASAMQNAAKNPGGAFVGFAGMNMAANVGGANAQSLFGMGGGKPAASEQGWKCKCGKVGNTGKFCSECGEAKSEEGWKCSCGAVNQGKFCSECGAKRPSGVPVYQCDKCGWKPDDPQHPPKFCPECGDKFDEDDIR